MLKTARPLLAVLLFIGVVAEWSGPRTCLDLESIHCILAAPQSSGVLVFVLLFALGNLIQIPGSLFLAATDQLYCLFFDFIVRLPKIARTGLPQ
ncbi:MAG: hypothetical protein Q7S85_09825 [Rugosibacter sp.]|nr:hypothetical protein [Rugosibacter sp.]